MDASLRALPRRRLALAAGLLAVLASFPLDPLLARAAAGIAPPFLDVALAAGRLRGGLFFILAGLAVTAAGSVLRRPRVADVGRRVIVAALVAGLLVGVLKPVFGRPGPNGRRPEATRGDWLERRWGRFPSGHTAPAFAAAAAVGAAFPPAAAPVFALAGLVAFERVCRRVHYPSDCVAGAVLGIGVGWYVGRARLRHGRSAPGEGSVRVLESTGDASSSSALEPAPGN
jgi:undecaprenyl-diphosphatase